MPSLSPTRCSSEPIDSASSRCWASSIGRGSTQFALGEDELQEQERAAFADVLDRLRQPLGDGGVAGRGGTEDRPVRAARARLVPGRDDQPALLEDLERAVDERAGQRPDRAELAGRRELSSQCPAMRRPLAEQSQHRPLPGRQVAIAHHPELRREPTDRFFRPAIGTLGPGPGEAADGCEPRRQRRAGQAWSLGWWGATLVRAADRA